MVVVVVVCKLAASQPDDFDIFIHSSTMKNGSNAHSQIQPNCCRLVSGSEADANKEAASVDDGRLLIYLCCLREVQWPARVEGMMIRRMELPHTDGSTDRRTSRQTGRQTDSGLGRRPEDGRGKRAALFGLGEGCCARRPPPPATLAAGGGLVRFRPPC